MKKYDYACGSLEHFSRRNLLKLAGLSGLSWLTPLGTLLARQDEANPAAQAKSVIIIWLEGAPSHLETFDPKPGTEIAAGSLARDTTVAGIQLGDGFERLAEQMEHVSLIRGLTSKEGDHNRAIYNIKTGFRPDPTLVHPAIGSVICHQLNTAEDQLVDIPRHISILPGQQPGRGGYLGDSYDAFKMFDPQNPVPDVTAHVSDARVDQRLEDLNVLNRRFLDRHSNNRSVDGRIGTHNLDAAVDMMSSEQLSAFDVSSVPLEERMQFGDTPFGRGCLTALRLIERGVRCVEVTLDGWDTHVNNHELQAGRIDILDPAIASLIKELKARDLLESTLVLCGGEFGRTPWLNAAGGRDHWPHGFSLAIAGGGIQGGRVIGETTSTPARESKDRSNEVVDSHPVEDVHATVFKALGIRWRKELDTPVGRPMRICEGQSIDELF
ncbi:MAG: DUF1501 domain-containing protein [Planctomycetota bacterium]